MNGELTQQDIDKQWPRFRVVCAECGSRRVELVIDLGASPGSGQWGGIHFKCMTCINMTTIYGDD